MRHTFLCGILLCLFLASCTKDDFEKDFNVDDIELDLRSPVSLSFHAKKTYFSEFENPIDTNSTEIWKIWSGVPIEEEFDFEMDLTTGGDFYMEISNISYYSEKPDWDATINEVDRITHDGSRVRTYDDSGNLVSDNPSGNSGFDMSEIVGMIGSLQHVTLEDIISDAESKGATVKQSPEFTIITKSRSNPNFEADEAMIFNNELEKLVINSVFDNEGNIDVSTMQSYDKDGVLEQTSILDYEYLEDGDVEIRRTIYEFTEFSLTI